MADYIGATPQVNPMMGLLAERLKQAQQFAAKPFGYQNPPVEMLMNLLGIPAVQQTVERLAYGEPLTTGRGMTTQVRPEVMEAAMTVAPTAGLLGRGVERSAMAAGRAGEHYAEKVVPQIMERGGMPSQLLADLSQGSIRPMDVWHGSPYGPFQKFDPSKARTGEGNASYGEGAYLAQARGTGEEYRKALTGNHNSDQFISTVDGLPTDSFVAKAIIREGGNPESFIAKMQSKLEKQLVGLEKTSKTDDLGLGITDYDMALMDVTRTQKIIEEASSYIGKAVKNEQPGYLYKVDLPDESIAKMIDWDKPLGKQSKEVQQAIEKTKSMLPSNAVDDLGGDLSLLYGKDVMPQEFLNTWESFESAAGGESALAKQGVTGVRYLDQESRNAGQFSITPPSETVSGKWMVKGTDYNSKGMQFDTEAEALAKLQEMNANLTSNFVVFPEFQDLLTIKEINDKPLRRNLLD